MLDKLQARLWEWQQRELPLKLQDISSEMLGIFPSSLKFELMEGRLFRGIAEELGELAHAQLKMAQSIRGSKEEHTEARVDALADMLIFMMQLATLYEIDLLIVTQKVAEKVMERKWATQP